MEGVGASSGTAKKKSWTRRIAAFAISFAIALLVGRAFETVASESTLNAALRAQSGWIAALNEFSPWGVAGTFSEKYDALILAHYQPTVDEGGRLVPARSDSPSPAQSLSQPLQALAGTIGALVGAGGVVGLAQIFMGALALALVLEHLKKRHRFEVGGPFVLVVWPLLVILTAGALAAALKLLMLGALGALSWVTGLAAGAAGATGVVGFCWYCLQKLGEKGAEHALTPKI